MDRLKVVIVGAGMGGLTAAIALRQAGYAVEVFDRVPELLPAGAGVSLWSNGIKVLDRLGLGEAVASVGGRMQRICYRSQSGELLTDFSLQPLVEAVGERPYPVTRTDLQRLLLDGLGQAVQLGAECIGIEQDEHAATAVFAGGRRATADLVVAADGTHSLLREHVIGRKLARRYVGYVNWNGLVPAGAGLPAADTWTTYVGEHKRVALMPVGGERFYFFFDVPLAQSGGPAAALRDELRGHFSGWAAPVQALIDRLEPALTSRIPIHDLDPLPQLVRGRVALLGDAAHSSPPDLGQGGCQALEDAWVLSQLLLTNNLGVPDALRRYEQARQARTAEIVLRARKRSEMTHGHDPSATEAWYAELAGEDGSNILGGIIKTILRGPL